MRSVAFYHCFIMLLISNVTPAGAIVEKDVAQLSHSTVMTYFQNNFIPGVMKNRDGEVIHYVKCEPDHERGALVVVDGRTEFIAKYAELFYDFRDTGFSYYIFDHRGQGESSRFLPDPEKGHVEHFDDYVEDLHQFLTSVVRSKPHTSVFLLSHSMGGAITVLLARKYPADADGMILCSPMFSINTAPFPPTLARIITTTFSKLGLGSRYVIGGKPYEPNRNFENNDLTDSFARYTLNRQLVEENPRVALGSPTFTWLSESFSAMGHIRDDTSPLRIPILLMVGEKDNVVGQKAQKQFCSIQPNCSLATFPNGKHELLMEKDQVRNAVFQHIMVFLNRYSGTF